jgi:hypothetical protein
MKASERPKINTSTDQRGRRLYAQLGTDPPSHGRFLLSPTQLIMMKIITWNIRGLNGRSKQRTLRNNILAENPRHSPFTGN